MRIHRSLLYVVIVAVLEIAADAAPFAMFPQVRQLASPDGRFVVYNADPEAHTSEFVGTFHSLYIEETTGGRRRKLCDYVGIAAVAWAPNDFLVLTEYMSKHTSRAIIFAADGSREPIVVDQPTLVTMVPINLRPQLRENDHVFVEASEVDGQRLTLRVWGYGKHDANGFRWHCEYALIEGTISCDEVPRH